MPNEATKQKIIDETETIAVVGFSSNPAKAGYYVADYLQRAGYRIIPVNPNLTEGLGQKAYASLGDIPEPVDLVLLFQRPQNVPPFVDEAIAIGADAVWMQLGISNEAAAAKAREHGLDVVEDACMMVDHRRLAGR